MSEGAAKGFGEKPQSKKEERRKFQAIKGTRDLLPPETALWNRVERIAQEVFASYGFGEIRLPIFEPTELFARAVGGETDIVSKEMYEFEDHAARDISALRTLLLEKNPEIDDPKYFISYELKVEEFRNRLQWAMESGTAPKTPSNERIIDMLGPLLNSMAAARDNY